MALKKGAVTQQATPASEKPVFDLEDAGMGDATQAAAESTTNDTPPAPEIEIEDALFEEVEEDAGTLLAVAQTIEVAQTTTIAGRTTGSSVLIQQMAEDGMEGMDLGFGAFPIITLGNDGEFSCRDLPHLPIKGFECIIHQSKQKFVWKNGLEDKDPKSDFFYSEYSPTFAPDAPRVTAAGKDMEEILAEWKAQGWVPVHKKYLDVVVTIVGGDCDGEMAVLSIPPASVTRLSGVIALAKMKHRLLQDQFVTSVSIGPKIQKGVTVYRPWAFSFVRPL